MKATKFTDAPKAFIIKQALVGTPVAEVCRKAGISSTTFFHWKKKYAGLMPSEMMRLRELEQENARQSSHWFMSLEDAAEKFEAWRRDYNEVRPHSAVGHKVTADLMKSAHDTRPLT